MYPVSTPMKHSTTTNKILAVGTDIPCKKRDYTHKYLAHSVTVKTVGMKTSKENNLKTEAQA